MILIQSFLLIGGTLFWIFYKKRTLIEIVFFLTLMLSSIYYGILGPWYWMEYQKGVFLGVDWYGELESVGYYFVAIYFLILIEYSLLPNFMVNKIRNNICAIDRLEKILILVGVFAAVYVLIFGAGYANTDNPDGFLMIFYQLADIPVAALLYRLGRQEVDKKWILGLMVYIVYSSIVGLRYKMVLVLGPCIIFAYLWNTKKSIFKKMIWMLVGIFFVLFLGVMTLARSKFEGVDWDIVFDMNMDEFLFGLFAESNIVFGLLSAITIFGSVLPYAGLDPIFDIFVQFIPRFLYPDKNLYLHLNDVKFGLGNSSEAMDSGTAMPFIGEYFAMGGYLGVIFGLTIYTCIVKYSLNMADIRIKSMRQRLVFGSLIAIFFAYYYFSRGSIAQISKSWLFIVFPYYLLARNKD